jgi:hypothetical protein
MLFAVRLNTEQLSQTGSTQNSLDSDGKVRNPLIVKVKRPLQYSYAGGTAWVSCLNARFAWVKRPKDVTRRQTEYSVGKD